MRTSLRVICGCLLLFAVEASAAVYNCATANFSEVQSNINLTIDGDSVTVTNFAAGTITTNHWTGTLTNAGQNITIQGPGPWFSVVVNEPVSPNTYVSNATTLVIVADTTAKHQISMRWSSNSSVGRITGFTFMPGTNSPGQGDSSQGFITYGGICMNARLDNNHFFRVGQANLQLSGWINGVADHNVTWESVGDFMFGDMPTYGGTNFNYGDYSWASADSLGTTNAFYVESFVYTNNPNAQGIFDGEQGCRLVARYGTFTNGSIVSHDIATGQRQRAFRQGEVYCNHAYWITNKVDQMLWPEFGNYRGGVWITFSNTVRNYNTPVRYSVYREQFCLWNPWGMANGTNTWDACSTNIYDSGTFNGTDGTALLLTDTTKSWTVNQWTAGFVVHNLNKGYAYGVVATNDAHNITYTRNGDSCGINTNFVWNTGDAYRIYYITNAIDQCGRGQGDLITGDTPVNSVLGGVTYPRQALDICYSWSNTITWDAFAVSQFGPVYTYPLASQTVVTNRDYLNNVIAPGYTPLVYPHPLVQTPIPPDPAITVQPSDQTVTSPATATFSVAASGLTALSYQWYKNAVLIGGATSSSYTTPATGGGDDGSLFYVIVTDTAGSLQSSTVTLHVNNPLIGGGGGPARKIYGRGTGQGTR
jgi:hypothetical protein